MPCQRGIDLERISTREHDIDIAKGIAMLLVIIGHTSYAPWRLVWWLYSFHMPLFFALSGLVFHPQKYATWRQFLRAKVRSLLIPYFCLCGVLWFWTCILQNKTDFINEGTLNGFLGIFLGYRLTEHYLSMWFILVLFVAEMILYALYRCWKENRKWYLAGFVITSVLGWGLLHFWKNGFYWSLDLVPICLSFLILGYIIRLFKQELKKWYNIYILTGAAVLNCIFAWLNHRVCDKSDLYFSNVGNYFYYIIAAVCGIAAVLVFCRLLKKNRILEYIGRNTLVFYAFQNSIFIPGAVQIVDSAAQRFGILGNQIVGLMIVVVLVCIGLAVWSEIFNKCFPFLLGKRRAGSGIRLAKTDKNAGE